ncbi:preprotein translocase subunit YajC [Algisphaera agarilytica]|uniref:Sec translocon accessory complex subunit YajC n=1 Tax=Algisphaera agarilytica TaxID=1385975 RepID=A0A7X0LM27_9BACT|nr:preprotein translocase subunit YajC [Algisphaera agarilytica]MBB6430578.1 preprotein translocase subunit YajC [Algisphaera agarilytica]
MNPFIDSTWPVTLAQADDSVAPASAELNSAVEGAPGAAGTQAPGGTQDGEATPSASPLSALLFPMILVIGLLFIFSMSGNRKEKKRRAELMANLSKGAKVQTVGGVIGKVVEVRDDEVLVKVDENTNTSLRFAKSAISSVTSED